MRNEAIIADHYRRYHPLARPKITWVVFFRRVVSALLVSLVFSLTVFFVLSAYKVIEWDAFPLNYFLQLYTLVILGFCLLFHKVILVSAIELYQHYASESTRRKCICMPSCSVYATMALKKYNTLKAMRLIFNRLSNCCGSVCIIDYP